jgi:hypothetical protein
MNNIKWLFVCLCAALLISASAWVFLNQQILIGGKPAPPLPGPVSVAPSAISIADNATGTVATASCTMSDASLCAGATFTLNDPHNYLTVSGSSINRTGTSLVDGTYTDLQLQATKNGHTFPAAPTNNLTLTVTSTAGGGVNAIIGWFGGGPFHAAFNRWPDFTTGGAYSGPTAGCVSPASLNGYPLFASFYSLDDGNPNQFQDAAAAASGAYDSTYQGTIDNCLKPLQSQLYGIRVNAEWGGGGCGNNFGVCPFNNFDQNQQRISPTDYVNMMRHVIALIHQPNNLPGVPIMFEAPMSTIEQAYWPGDDVIDLTGLDIYFQPFYDGTQAQSWAKYTTNPGPFGPSLQVMDAWSVAHNKPMVIPEWCDAYLDGVNLTLFANWMKSHNVVAHAYWNTPPNSSSDTCDADTGTYPTRQQAYFDAFANTHYTGTYFTLKTIPPGGGGLFGQ